MSAATSRGGTTMASTDTVRAAFNAMYEGAPARVASCASAQEVADALAAAHSEGLEVAIRGGGHSIAGLSSTDGGMLIDLAAMNGVEVDADGRRARVQGGALWGDVDRATQAHGLVAPGGVVSDTGVAGLTLGGGYGWVRRKYGLSCDHVVEAEVVLADGRVVTASESENEDLFWALRGGGGNFGVVTSFTFDLNELGPEVAFSATMYPLEDLAGVMRGWRDFADDAPNEVTSVVVTMTFPENPEMPPEMHDRPVAIIGGVYAGPVDEGMEATAPLRELGEPVFDMSGPTPFVDVQTGFDALFPRNTLRAYWKAQYVDELTDDAIGYLGARAQDRPAPLTLLNTFQMGGAIADVDPEATAFATRKSPYMISIDGTWTAEQSSDEDAIGWVRETFDSVSEFGNGDVYLNFTGRAGEDASAGTSDQFGRNLDRLAEVKSKYDPENFFRLNNNIAPK